MIRGVSRYAVYLVEKKKFLTGVNRTGVSDDSRYLYLPGTSMATPLVAGCCVAVRECLLKNGYKDEVDSIKTPTASLIKTLIINGAVPIAGQYMADHVRKETNPHSGFGRVNVVETIAMIGPNKAFTGYGISVINEITEEPFVIQIPVPPSDNSLTLKLTMAYAHLPGASLCNDLNLVVVAGD
ncbi:hypothetical protein G7Z17_g698 [Cylindrodendrum hubeiense]|uniref:Peptidase S8/S53 domain-containing protein n=1 Tax=Cylindrodendrum hubeiense TaxID=595255 RepID=A0A9P5HL28_9HYPO|nr:hypothetical protein G7Z17_g698 [Cylindrodendrum hubeiense]